MWTKWVVMNVNELFAMSKAELEETHDSVWAEHEEAKKEWRELYKKTSHLQKRD